MAGKSGKKLGRPSDYNEGISALICELIANGQSLRSICEEEGKPSKRTVLMWLRTHEDFRTQYTRAREDQAEGFFEELIEIADDSSEDVAGELGMPNGVAVQRAKLRVETRKWAMVKLLPKKYGEKLDVNATVSGEIAVRRVVTDL